MEFVISRVSHDDGRLVDLHRACLPSDRLPTWGSGWWWIATNSGLPVGFAGIQPSSQWGDAGYLVRAGVVDSFRGHGLQKRLIRVRERYAKTVGMRWVITSTYKNPASANSLIACGFRLYEPASPWGVNGTLYWKKRIQ